jgi:hypothetical protein
MCVLLAQACIACSPSPPETCAGTLLTSALYVFVICLPLVSDCNPFQGLAASVSTAQTLFSKPYVLCHTVVVTCMTGLSMPAVPYKAWRHPCQLHIHLIVLLAHFTTGHFSECSRWQGPAAYVSTARTLSCPNNPMHLPFTPVVSPRT